MNTIRKIQTTISIGIAVILASAGVLYLVGGLSLIPHTIENSRAIDKSFSIASSWVNDFTQSHSRLPSSQEFTAWTISQSDQVYGVRDISLIVSESEFPQQLIKSFGQPNTGSYVLELWRGEWFEYFASWAHASTVDSAAGLYGSAVAISLSFFAAGVAFWYLSRKYRSTSRSTESVR